jgi:hypothetical protein
LAINKLKNIEVDIVIVGGGSAGVAAAIAAVADGNSVMLIERNAYLGGKATAAEVGTICGLYQFSLIKKSTYIVGGFAQKFANQLSELSNTAPLSNQYGLHYLPYVINDYKTLCAQLLAANKVKVLLNTSITEVNNTNSKIKSIAIQSGAQSQSLFCKAIVDCSGDSCVSVLAQLPLIKSESYQAAAQVFTIEKVAATNETNLNLILLKALQKAISENIIDKNLDRIYIVAGSLINNQVSLKLGIPSEVTYEPNNVEILRKKAVQLIHQLMEFLTSEVPVFKGACLQSIAPEVGTRVGLRPVGKYILTEDDVLQCRKFDAAIANGAWPIEEWGDDKRVNMRYFSLDDFYQIPVDCLISNSAKNLFFGGRNISATDGAIASARVMGICFQTGFAAGKLASDSLNNTPIDKTISAIQKKQLL